LDLDVSQTRTLRKSMGLRQNRRKLTPTLRSSSDYGIKLTKARPPRKIASVSGSFLYCFFVLGAFAFAFGRTLLKFFPTTWGLVNHPAGIVFLALSEAIVTAVDWLRSFVK
jgi:hypothetical protein